MPRNPGVEVVYDVPRVRQRSKYWCWAACLEMVAGFYMDRNATQEAFAAFAVQKLGGSGSASDTNIMGGPADIVLCAKKILALQGIDWSAAGGKLGNSQWPVALDDRSLRVDLDNGRLMIIGYDEHARVVTGYKMVDGVLYLYIIDPDDGSLKLVRYAAVKARLQYRVTFGAWTSNWARMIEEDPGLA